MPNRELRDREKVNKNVRNLGLAFVAFFLGFLLTIQFQTQQNYLSSLEALSTNDLITIWQGLTVQRENLQAELTEIRRNLFLMEQESATSENIQETLAQNIKKYQLFTGSIPVQGPGIIITITGDAGILHYDLIDLVNELWAAGAEAIAINDERVIQYTAIEELGRENGQTTITVNGKEIFYPCVIKAIGDAAALEKGLKMPGGIIDNLNTWYAIYPEIRQHNRLELPAAAPVRWKYAQPIRSS